MQCGVEVTRIRISGRLVGADSEEGAGKVSDLAADLALHLKINFVIKP